MQKRGTLVAVLLAIAAAAAVYSARNAMNGEVASGATPGPPTATWEVVTVPAEYPTPHDFASGAEVLQYVHDLLDPLMVWQAWHVKRARIADYELMRFGSGASFVTPAPGETPSGRHPDSPYGQREYWIVGVKTISPVAPDKLDRAQFRRSPDSWAVHPGGTELYFVVDDFGNIVEAGYLDAINDQGTPEHYAPWTISDIDALPTPP